jgi:Mg-chelatase subunit ChlD
MTVGTWLELAEQAAEAALPALVDELFARLNGELIPSASFAELVALLAFVGRIVEGHIVGLATTDAKPQTDFSAAQEALLAAALAALSGVEGSTQDSDVQAFAEVVALYTDREEGRPVPLLLTDAIRRFSEQGSPLLRGAALAAHALLDETARPEFSNIFVSFFEFGTDDANGAQERSGRIRGALVLGGPRFEGDPAFTDAVLAGIDSLEESAFLRKLPSLRRGFDVLSAAGRQRMLDALGEGAGLLTIAADPSLLAFGAEADAAGSAAVVALGLGGLETSTAIAPTGAKQTVKTGFSDTDGRRLTLADRLRLLLGREAERLSCAAAPFGRALDELYGQGHGEGSREGGGAGRGAPFPTAREWADELTTLFGDRVREEVLGAAAEAGYGAAATALDPETVQPSVALLEQLLALRGGLGEKDLAHLRKLIEKIVSALARELATRIRPALSGLATPRPSRRARGPLDLRRTIRENLGTARPRSAHAEDGYALTPKDFFFKTRAKKSVDWQVVLLVDVSGSMEPSTIYAALVASILAKIPALSTKFITFSDGVVDLSEHVDDPLELLLGIRIGGGTNIGGAIRFARTLARVPSRTLLVCVSDFEEGASVPTLIAEVRDVVGSGITALGLAALDDRGAPRFHRGIAERVAGAGMPIAALSPEELAGWIGERVRGR